MPQFDQSTRDLIDALRQLRTDGEAIEGPYELVKIEWPSPTGTKYYATTAVDEVASSPPPVSVELRLIPDNYPNSFLPVAIDSTVGDEEVDLKFWDADGAISDEVLTHGEGLRVTLLYWFPQVALLLPIWEGHLRAEDEGQVDTVTLKAVQGFRASEASIPSRGHYAFCQAPFGGILTTQEEIDEGGCDYNRQIMGGTVGTLDPDTGQPWTFCPRRSTNDCILRGVNPLRHLSHRTIVNTVVNTQSSGARLLSTSQGNETNLSEPVRVVMGRRRIYDMKVIAFRKDLNQNDPDRGWYQGFYEACEGPVDSITQARIKVGDIEQNAVPLHHGARLGNFGDASPDISLTPHGFSATAFIRYAYGWINPEGIDPEDASANAVISGLRDIRTYRNVTSTDNGLIATYFLGNDFTTGEIGKRIIDSVNFPTSFDPPIGGMPMHNWCVEINGFIKPRYSENYTFTINHDDGVKLWVNNTVVIDQLTNNGTHSGNISLTADTPYPIKIQFIQETFHWFYDLKWQSASQALEIVPNSRLTLGVTGQLMLKQPTSNRAWQIARILCDKRWGFGYDYARLNIDSWIEAAAWVEENVRYTDPLGNIWDHPRGMSDVELIERKVQQQIEDMCLAGRLSRPFLFDGEIHIMPLRALTSGELAACPEFTDEGNTARNIIWEGEGIDARSTLTFKRSSSFELPNKIECTYDSAADDYKKTPLQPVEDINAQLAAGRVVGENSKKVNPKKYHLLGVTGEAHAMKLQWGLLDLGPFDEGGLQNNLRLMFKIWFLDALDLHVFKVIKVTSSRITKYGFTHFRIMKMERADNLHYELEVQAYNHSYMTAFETLIEDLPNPPSPPSPPGPPPEPPPQCILQFGTITYQDGVLDIPIPQCAGITAILDGGAPTTVFANITDSGNANQTYTAGYDGGEA